MMPTAKNNIQVSSEKSPAVILKELADKEYETEDFPAAESNYRKAAEAFSHIGDSQQASFCYEAAGAAAYYAGDIEQSLRNFKTALQENEQNATALKQLGFIFQEKDKPWSDITLSISCIQMALKLFEESQDHDQIFTCASNLALIFI